MFNNKEKKDWFLKAIGLYNKSILKNYQKIAKRGAKIVIKTACGLDCPDACGIVSDSQYFPKVVADSAHPTSNGALCSLLNRYIHEEPRITKARIGKVEVSMDEVLEAIRQALKVEKKLLWRGSGNFGVMQEITNLLFDKIGGTTTKGSLCDGAGDAGTVEGRGVNRILPL